MRGSDTRSGMTPERVYYVKGDSLWKENRDARSADGF